jgi:hypothetical protein
VVGAGIGVLAWLTFYFSDKPIGASCQTSAERHQHSTDECETRPQENAVAEARGPQGRHPLVDEVTAGQRSDGRYGDGRNDKHEFPIGAAAGNRGAAHLCRGLKRRREGRPPMWNPIGEGQRQEHL